MDVQKYMALIRSRLDDAIGGDSGGYWSSYDLIDDYANEAIDELFNELGDIIHDTLVDFDMSTPTPLPLCTVPLTKDVKFYDVSPCILKILHMTLRSSGKSLVQKDYSNTISMYPNWRTISSGTPNIISMDFKSGSVLVLPPPSSDDFIDMVISRTMFNKLAHTDNVSIEIKDEYLKITMSYVMHLAFKKQDSEVFNPALSEKYLSEFNDRVQLAKVRSLNSRMGSGTVMASRGSGSR